MSPSLKIGVTFGSFQPGRTVLAVKDLLSTLNPQYNRLKGGRVVLCMKKIVAWKYLKTGWWQLLNLTGTGSTTTTTTWRHSATAAGEVFHVPKARVALVQFSKMDSKVIVQTSNIM